MKKLLVFYLGFTAVLFCSAVMAAGKTVSTAAASKAVIRDCAHCPEMVVLPAGHFLMGASAEEEEREGVRPSLRGRSLPQHEVTVAAVAIARYEVTRDEYARFVAATGRPDPTSCLWLKPELSDAEIVPSESWRQVDGHSWKNPGFAQTSRDPVVCVSWEDATAYTQWLSKITGKAYRLPTEAEWEYAARAGTTTAHYWGDSVAEGCAFGNLADATLKAKYPAIVPFQYLTCDDGRVYTAPVGSYRPNDFGLFDMIGNAWELVDDCWKPDYTSASSNSNKSVDGDCSQHIVRGGAWNDVPWSARAAVRFGIKADFHGAEMGFRVARLVDRKGR